MRALIVTLAACALVAAGCGGGDDERAAAPPPTDSPATETTTGPPDQGVDRPPAPPIAGTSLEGDRVSLADFAGRPVLVNVWSSW